MGVKITISYNEGEELERDWILRQISPRIRSWKFSKNERGKYRKTYVKMKSNVTNR